MSDESIAADAAIDGDAVLRSHDVAEFAGTTPRALRHYHQIGLLPEVPRDSNGYRRYSARDLVRVLRIRQLAAGGVPLRKIGTLLDQGTQSQDSLLAELDRELKAEVERIEAQRKVMAELRRRFAQTARFNGGEGPSVTQQFDQDVWTLVTASGDIDADTAASIQDVLQSEAVAGRIAAWHPEFERLEAQAHVDEASAERLVGQMVSFVETVTEATGITPFDEAKPIAGLIEGMQDDAFSPAQQQVWSRFLAAMETRWGAGSDSAEGGSEPAFE